MGRSVKQARAWSRVSDWSLKLNDTIMNDLAWRALSLVRAATALAAARRPDLGALALTPGVRR